MNQLQSKQKIQDSRKNPQHHTGQSMGFSKAAVHPYLQAQGIIGNHGILRRHNSNIIQAKLKIGQPNDKYEQEADRLAEQVMRMPEPGESLVNSQWSLGKSEKESSSMQRQSTCRECPDKEELQTKPVADRITPIVQGEAEAGVKPVTAALHSRIQSLRDGGQPLPESMRAFFESRFGTEFRSVRIHTDSKAANAAKSVNARAFTLGKHVVFESGQFSPQTKTGKRLLAHELTHTLQQRGGDKTHTSMSLSGIDHSMSCNSFPIIQRDATDDSPWEDILLVTLGVGSQFLISTGPFNISTLFLRNKIIEHGRKTIVDIKGQSRFRPDKLLIAYIRMFGKDGDPVAINVRYGDLASGTIQVYWFDIGEGIYVAPFQGIPMEHPELKVNEPNRRLELGLTIGKPENTIRGMIGVTPDYPLTKQFRDPGQQKINRPPQFNEDALLRSILGRTYARGNLSYKHLQNALEGGHLNLDLIFSLETAGVNEITGAFVLINENAGWGASMVPEVAGLKEIKIDIDRDPNGVLSAEQQNIGVNTNWTLAGFEGSLNATFVDGLLEIRGDATYDSPRLDGNAKVTLLATKKSKARAAARAHLPFEPPDQQPEAGVDTLSEKMALTGWGTAEIIVTKPLPGKKVGPIKGTVAFVVDPDGFITTHGTVRALRRWELLEQKGWNWNKKPVTFNKSYGVPLGYGFWVKVQPNLQFDVDAFLGPITLYDLTVDGVYSTGPYPTEFNMSGRLNISAGAVPSVKVGGKLLVSFIKAAKVVGISLDIKGEMPLAVYLDTKPTINVQQKKDVECNKKEPPDYSLNLAISAGGKVDLKLNGVIRFSLVHIDLKDINLFERTYRIVNLGIEGQISHTFGSGDKPKVSFKRNSFRPSLFLTDLLKRRPAKVKRKSDKMPAIEGTVAEGGREIETRISSEENIPLNVEPAVPPIELKEQFSMESQPHTLFLKLGGPGTSASLEMESGGRRLLLEKIKHALALLESKRGGWWMSEDDRRQLDRRIRDLNDILESSEKVIATADRLGVDPQRAIYTFVPGFTELAQQLQLYGDRYGAKDIIGKFLQPSTLLEIPDIDLERDKGITIPKVPGADAELVQRMVDKRESIGYREFKEYVGKNIAVFKYFILNREEESLAPDHSNADGPHYAASPNTSLHSEVNIMGELQEIQQSNRGRVIWVDQILSERKPCGQCMGIIKPRRSGSTRGARDEVKSISSQIITTHSEIFFLVPYTKDHVKHNSALMGKYGQTPPPEEELRKIYPHSGRW